jgi:hypothetical protein
MRITCRTCRLICGSYKEYRFWWPYRNQEIFSDPYTISPYNYLDDLKELLDTFVLHDYTLKQRPDTNLTVCLLQISEYLFLKHLIHWVTSV